MIVIDLNMDLGEGMAIDAQVMPFISSCNIACGGHYGDENSIKTALLLAQQLGVKAGAHPSFEDRENFGRKHLDWDESRFCKSVLKQIKTFHNVAQELDIPMSHIKMHGALYHATANQPDFVQWTVDLMKTYFQKIPLFVPYNSLLEKEMNKSDLLHITEAFADRRYHAAGTLVSRLHENAVISDVPKLINQLAMMVYEKKVLSVEENDIEMNAQTYCIHGDNEQIVNRFHEVIASLKINGIQIG
ncbi:MAG: LamB/YcsF family protein [Nonlabens sp.]|uniref:LamB/YcsF family protein n=1 Tax=Nonlabens sp. TaxID=1888209 RepID=UPI003EF885DE